MDGEVGGEDVDYGEDGEDVEVVGVDLAEVADNCPVGGEEREDFVEPGGVGFGTYGKDGAVAGGLGCVRNESLADVTFGVEEVDKGFAPLLDELAQGASPAVGVDKGEVGALRADAVFENLVAEHFGALPSRRLIEEEQDFSK